MNKAQPTDKAEGVFRAGASKSTIALKHGTPIFDGLGIASITFEVFTEKGLAIKAISPF